MIPDTATLRYKVLTAKELEDQAELLHDITTLVNVSFHEHRLFDEGVRFESDPQICMEMGNDGICVIMLDMSPADKHTPIAVACAKVPEDVVVQSSDMAAATIYGRMRSVMEKTGEALDYEVFSVCTRRGYRKRGYAQQCIKILQDELLSQAGQKRVNLWARVVERENGPYWKRRGFEQIDFVDCPKGMWHAKEGFRLLMMLKKLEKSDGEVVLDMDI